MAVKGVSYDVPVGFGKAERSSDRRIRGQEVLKENLFVMPYKRFRGDL